MMSEVIRPRRVLTLALAAAALVVVAWGGSDLSHGELQLGAYEVFGGLFALSAAVGRIVDATRPQRSHRPDLAIAMIGFLVIGNVALVAAALARDRLFPLGVVAGALLDGIAALAAYGWWTTRRRYD